WSSTIKTFAFSVGSGFLVFILLVPGQSTGHDRAASLRWSDLQTAPDHSRAMLHDAKPEPAAALQRPVWKAGAVVLDPQPQAVRLGEQSQANAVRPRVPQRIPDGLLSDVKQLGRRGMIGQLYPIGTLGRHGNARRLGGSGSQIIERCRQPAAI